MLTQFDPYIKGEPPVSAKFNRFTRDYSSDLNIIAKQLDYLTAKTITSFNLMTSEVEQENSFIQRIKNKVKVLQMYSNSPANDLFYVGNSFDNSDYVDFSRISNSSLMPLINNGQMTLSTKSTSIWSIRRVYVDENNSNGYIGNNHAAYQFPGEELNYRYFFKDYPLSRNLSGISDGNPLSFFEYEQIHVNEKPQNSRNFEFNYSVPGGANQPTTYKDWSTFSADGKLRLTLVIENDSMDKANYINITPYFGSNGYISKDVVVSKIEITNNKDEVENILKNPIYISSGFIPSSLDVSKNFYYREAKVKFSERKIKFIKIYFEQENYTETKVKHVYFKPYIRQYISNTSNLINYNPYYNQERFNPEQPLLSSDYGYSSIPWSEKIYNISQIVPLYNQPNIFKSETGNTSALSVTLKRDIPVKTGWSVEALGSDGKVYYITNQFRSYFDYDVQATPRYGLTGYDTITATTLGAYITSKLPSGETGSAEGWISNTTETNNGVEVSEAERIANEIVAWFNQTSQSATKAQKYTKFGFVLDSVRAVQRDTTTTKKQTKTFNVDLQRQYEMLDAKRKSISIRDINIGYEEYLDKAEMVSRAFDFKSAIEYLTLSSDVGYSGELNSSDINKYIKYYISLDGGSWIEISPIENSSSQTKEVLAFNQNIENTFKIPGIEYYNSPTIPEDPKSVSVKIEIQKPNGENITPIIYSYKLGVKVKQI